MPLLHRGRHHLAPGVLRLGDLLAEVRVGEQRRQLRVARVRGADPVEERGADDAAAAPDDRHLAEVDVPAVLLAARGDHVPALGVGHDLRRVERLLDLVRERARVRHRRAAVRAGAAPWRRRAGSASPDRPRAKTASAIPLTGTPRSRRDLDGPPARALLLGLVEDDVDEGAARRRVGVGEDVGGDLDEVGVEAAGVPGTEDRRRSRPASTRRRAGAGRTPPRSAACRRTRCRCAPSSRSGRRRPGRREWRTARRRPSRRCSPASGRATHTTAASRPA